jgi:hypothetical protein
LKLFSVLLKTAALDVPHITRSARIKLEFGKASQSWLSPGSAAPGAGPQHEASEQDSPRDEFRIRSEDY